MGEFQSPSYRILGSKSPSRNLNAEKLGNVGAAACSMSKAPQTTTFPLIPGNENITISPGKLEFTNPSTLHFESFGRYTLMEIPRPKTLEDC
jgi:hypothetical protein